jgi:6-phosphogluconolactonase
MHQVRVYPTRAAAAHAVAAQFVAASERAMTMQGRFTVALAGGSTPRDVYRLLASDDYMSMVEWAYGHFFWGDERAVPLNDPDNNAHTARESLLDHVPIPMNHIHRIPSQLPPEEAAWAYEQTLREFFGSRGLEQPQFDLVLLGMGAEGHTASLFPHSPALWENERWVMATYVDLIKSWRVTLTPLALNAAAKVIFLVAGEEKAQALKEVLGDQKQPELFPAQIIDPPQGKVLWVVDQAAASLLDS